MIVDALNRLQNITTGVGATDVQIERAEKELGLSFAPEYIQYLKRFGIFTANGLEMTGITGIERLNVVSATRRERVLNRNMPEDMYVIENLAIHGFVALQDATGAIYYISPCAEPMKMFSSLEKFVEITKI